MQEGIEGIEGDREKSDREIREKINENNVLESRQT